MSAVLRWVQANSIMLINSISLVGTTAITSILGFVYWWVAARRFSPEAVGIASASVSAMTLFGGFCILGLGTLLITEIPRQPERAGALISTALIVVGVVGGVIGIAFAIVAPSVSTGFKPLGASFLNSILFGSGVSLTAVTLILDQSLVGLLRGELQFWRNVLFAVLKLALLFVVSVFLWDTNGIAIYTTWTAGNACSILALAVFFILKKGWPGKNYRPQWSLLRKLGAAALQHHLLNMILQAPALLLPVLVTVMLSATMNAWFYVAWMVSSFVFLMPNVLTIVLHAMNSAQHATLARKARITLSLGLVSSIVANGLFQLAAPQVLSLFGRMYAEQAAWTLRLLLLAAFPLIIKYHYISVCRIHDRIARAMFVIFPCGLLELMGAIVGARIGGLTGLSAGWVIAIYIESLLMINTVYKAVRIDKRDLAPLTRQQRVVEAFWLMDTVPLPVISKVNSCSYLEAIALSEGEERGESSKMLWFMDTSRPLALRLPAFREAIDGRGNNRREGKSDG